VHPSSTEGNSNPLLEALAMNVPIICTEAGIVGREFKDLVTIIEPTYESLYKALVRFKSRQRIIERFQWKDICQTYKDFYRRMLIKKQKLANGSLRLFDIETQPNILGVA
jgi:glycosyltransferase involved in cell wall biosynthesis